MSGPHACLNSYDRNTLSRIETYYQKTFSKGPYGSCTFGWSSPVYWGW